MHRNESIPFGAQDAAAPPHEPGREGLRRWVTGFLRGFRSGSSLHSVLGAIGLVVLAFLVYAPILPGAFVMDDRKLIETGNPLVNGTLSPYSIWFQADFPLSTFVFWIQWILWGQNPGGYHAVNIALHAVSAVLLWRLLARLRIPGAGLAALIFAVHPVGVATVGRIAELKNTLSLPFFLLSFLAYLRYDALYQSPAITNGTATRPRAGHIAFWYSLSLVAFVLALLSKTSTLMLPVVLLGFVAWQRNLITRQDILQISPYFLLSLAFGLMTSWFQKNQALTGLTLQSHNFLDRLALAGRIIWFYLGKALMPLHLNLVYPEWHVDGRAFSSHVPAFMLVAVLGICWRFRRSWGRHALFGLGAFAVLLFPALGFFDSQFLTMWQVSDHLQYLPLVAVISLGGAALAGLLKFEMRLMASLPLVLALSLLSRNRSQLFTNEENMWRQSLASNPAAWAAHNDLGCILARRDNHSEAIEHFHASLRYNPHNPEAHSNLGQALALQGQFDQAEIHFRNALKIKPDSADVHKRFGAALRMRGRHREAMLHLRAALSLKAEVQTRMDYSALLYQTGDALGAAAQIRQVLAVSPDLPDALNNLAWLLATSSNDAARDGAQAVHHAERACQFTGFKQSRMLGTLAAAYAEAGRFPEAIATAEKALQLEIAGGETAFAGSIRFLLQNYRAGKCWHEVSTAPKPERSLKGNGG